MQRPMGVTILAVLAAIGGVIDVLAGIVLLGVSTVSASFALPIAGLASVLGFLLVATGILDFVFAYGAWGLKPWAWMLGIVLMVVRVVLDVLTFQSSSAVGLVEGIVISGIIIYYLYRPNVRAAFGQTV
jgi:uncharacterized membrane protein (DUF2068 family)